MGFKYQNPIVKPLLKETARLSRLKWANENYKVDFSNIIFSDETTVELYRNIKKDLTEEELNDLKDEIRTKEKYIEDVNKKLEDTNKKLSDEAHESKRRKEEIKKSN